MADITLGQFYEAIRQSAREGTLQALKELLEEIDFATNTSLNSVRDSIGSLSDAAASAGGTGSVSAKLRRLTADLADVLARLNVNLDSRASEQTLAQVLSALSTLTGTVDAGAQKVALTGSLPSGANIIGGVTHVGDMWESVTLVNAQAITDTNNREVSITQYLRQYEKIAFVFTNTLGVQVNVTLHASIGGNQWFGPGSPSSSLFPSVLIRSGNSLQRVLLDESFEGWERLNSGLTQGLLRYAATSAPSSGSLTIILRGLKKGVVTTT